MNRLFNTVVPLALAATPALADSSERLPQCFYTRTCGYEPPPPLPRPLNPANVRPSVAPWKGQYRFNWSTQ